MNNTSSTITAETGLTTDEITRASRHLSVTRGFLLESVSGPPFGGRTKRWLGALARARYRGRSAEQDIIRIA